MSGTGSTSGNPYHPDPKLDIYMGNMVANRGCEPIHDDGAVGLVCGCPKQHIKMVRLVPDNPDGYGARKIQEFEKQFTCC